MTVKFIHIRNTETVPQSGGKLAVSHMGGMTIAYKHLQNGNTRIGVAVCSDKDHYNMKLGRIKATGRMLSTNRKWVKDIRGEVSPDRIRMIGKIMGINLVPESNKWNKYRWMTKHSVMQHNANIGKLSPDTQAAFDLIRTEELAPDRSLSA